MNIPDMLMKCVTGSDTLNSIASAVGLGRDDTSKAVSASIPALLAAFTHTASSPQGAQQLANAAAQQDVSILDNISGTLSSRGNQLAQQGNSLLSSILGGGQMSALGSVLSRFTSLGEGSISKILGMITPVVLGFLGRQSAGLGPSGLANMLMGQKDYIRSAMPSGLANMMSSALPGVGDIFGGARQHAEAAAATARNVYDRRPVAPSPARWLVPSLVALALIGLLAMWARRGRVREEPTVTASAPVVQRNTPEAIGGPVRSVTGVATSDNFVSETTRLMSEATKALTGVHDGASANAAAEKLKDINAQLESSRSAWTSMSDSARTLAQNTLTPLETKLETAAQSVLNMPTIGDTIRPQVNELLKNLRTYTSTPPPQ